MDEAPVSAPIPEFKDRTTALMIFGVIEILLGCLSALMVPFMFFVQKATQQAAGGQANAAAVAPAALMYGLGAVIFIWLGIGSIKLRRWARALWLVIGWCWLVTGVISMGFMIVMMPRILATPPPGAQPMPPGAATMALAIMLPFMSCFYIILPGALVLFYRSPHVKATCDTEHPDLCWTDACPLPVLGLSLLLAFGAAVMLCMPLGGMCAMPMFGVLFSGASGAVLILAMTALWAYLAWALYRLKPAGWWLTVAAFAVFLVSTVLNALKLDFLEMYRAMDYPEQQIEMIERYGMFSGGAMWWLTVAIFVPMLGYMVWVKKYFTRPA